MKLECNIDPETYQVDMSFADEANKYILEKRIDLIKDMDNTIRSCIKKEIKKYGSIVKRYNSWKEFIGDNILIIVTKENGCEIQILIYRGKVERVFVFDYKII